MMQWLALIIVFGVLYKLLVRVASLEESADHLRVTIAELRSKLLAQDGDALRRPPADKPVSVPAMATPGT
jgi:hypothetical protein